MAHLDEHKLLSDKQHAFRKLHSCETQLATAINEWAKMLDNKGQVDTFILDFKTRHDKTRFILSRQRHITINISSGALLNRLLENKCLKSKLCTAATKKADQR